MSQVNYIQQINMFMEFGKRNGLTSYERMFWLGLFHIANMWAQRSPNPEWPDDFFPVSNSEIEAWSGLEERNIRAIRNRFKQIGLIDFKKGDGRRSDPEYRLCRRRYHDGGRTRVREGSLKPHARAFERLSGTVRRSVQP